MRTESLRNHASVALPIVLALAVSGCLNLEPVANTSRYFVLTSIAAAPAAPPAGPVVGVARVEIPDYLQPKVIALRKSDHEMQYSDSLQWAEQLDKGIQRVLGANLSSLLGGTNVLLSRWRRSDVWAEVYVTVQRFETDEHGRAVLEARWRVTTPGAETTLRAEISRIARQGPHLAENPDGATSALSETLSDLSREVATAIREMTPMSSRSGSRLNHGAE